ncbi:MAG: hypothetical protein ACPGWR_26125 [Ardenticatenaceae bacterium]
MKLNVILLIFALLFTTGCGNNSPVSDGVSPTEQPPSSDDHSPTEQPPSSDDQSPTEEQRFPDVLDVVLTPRDDGTFDVAVTLSSPYDSPERYADAWRILAPDGTQLGERILTHHHANEQPFTRSLSALTIPQGITKVTVEGRDQTYGYGGQTLTVNMPGR